MAKNNQYLSSAEVAAILGISRVAVFKKIKSGDIKAVKVGRNFIIDKNDLPKILGEVLSADKKKKVEKAVEKVVKEYGQTLRLLGKE